MRYPNKKTRIFQVFVCLFEAGKMTLPEIVAKIGTTLRGEKGDKEMLLRACESNYLEKDGEYYLLQLDIFAYVEDVMDFAEKLPIQNLVQARTPNVYTKEMRGYEHSLFAGKRGYQ